MNETPLYLLFTDETNKEASETIEYFAYGGLFVPAKTAGALHAAIETARVAAGYKATDKLKFDTNARPAHVTQEAVTALKSLVIQHCVDAGCKFSILLILHSIARNVDLDTRIFRAARHVIGHFNYFLIENNAHGWVFVDRLPVKSPDQFLADTFANGLEFDDGSRTKLDRLVGLSSVSLGTSHLCSAIDIVLGTFRYCLNNIENGDKVRPMLQSVARMLWWREADGKKYIRERGLIIRPKAVKVQHYQEKYDNLVRLLEGLLNAQ